MENKKEIKMEKWAVAVMLVLGVLFYFVPGKWISLESDSVAYLYARGREGVLPGYPVFLSFFQTLLGEENFLSGVVVAQSVLAIMCTFVFVKVLQGQFWLRGWECILLYIATMLPFSIYLPESGITHQIMTEGITYAIFYLYFIMILKSVWTLKLRWYGGSLFVAFVLGMIRSQMLFLQATCFLLLLWMVWEKGEKGFWRRTAKLSVAVIVGILVAVASYKLIYTIVIYDNQRVIEEVKEEEQEEKEAQEIEDMGGTPENVYIVRMEQGETPSQFNSLIISRGFFEADREDVSLFKDEMMQDIFLKTYELADESGHLYQYAKSGLYMWEDLVYDGMTRFVGQAIASYDEENPGVRTRDSASITRELGVRVLLKHFDRYLYHVIRLMLPSFIASVFFQIKPIYLLCHFVAMFIYFFAIISSMWLEKRDGDKKVIEYTLTVVLFLIVMVTILNLVFIGLQRYVVYGMGIFYCAMYLQLKEIYRLYKNRV